MDDSEKAYVIAFLKLILEGVEMDLIHAIDIRAVDIEGHINIKQAGCESCAEKMKELNPAEYKWAQTYVN